MYYVYGYLCICMCVCLCWEVIDVCMKVMSVCEHICTHLQRELGLHCLGGLRQFIKHCRGLYLSNGLMEDLSGILGSPGWKAASGLLE